MTDKEPTLTVDEVEALFRVRVKAEAGDGDA